MVSKTFLVSLLSAASRTRRVHGDGPAEGADRLPLDVVAGQFEPGDELIVERLQDAVPLEVGRELTLADRVVNVLHEFRVGERGQRRRINLSWRVILHRPVGGLERVAQVVADLARARRCRPERLLCVLGDRINVVFEEELDQLAGSDGIELFGGPCRREVEVELILVGVEHRAQRVIGRGQCGGDRRSLGLVDSQQVVEGLDIIGQGGRVEVADERPKRPPIEQLGLRGVGEAVDRLAEKPGLQVTGFQEPRQDRPQVLDDGRLEGPIEAVSLPDGFDLGPEFGEILVQVPVLILVPGPEPGPRLGDDGQSIGDGLPGLLVLDRVIRRGLGFAEDEVRQGDCERVDRVAAGLLLLDRDRAVRHPLGEAGQQQFEQPILLDEERLLLRLRVLERLERLEQARSDDLVDERAEFVDEVIDHQALESRGEELGGELVFDLDGEVGAEARVSAFAGGDRDREADEVKAIARRVVLVGAEADPTDLVEVFEEPLLLIEIDGRIDSERQTATIGGGVTCEGVLGQADVAERTFGRVYDRG